MGRKRVLKSLRIDALPLLNKYIENCRFADVINQFVPSAAGTKIAPSDIILFLLRNIMLSRFPLYKLSEWSRNYIPQLLGLSEEVLSFLNDDRIGRSLDQLFCADRATLSTMIALEVIQKYQIQMKSCHNDSTTVSFSGQYNKNQKFEKAAVKLKKGFNKDHRPDLKQLVFNLVVSGDGAVPIHFKLYDGNTTDDTTHRLTWDKLRALIGHPDFVYVADSKLCTKDNMKHIANGQGKFITVLPRTRKESQEFLKWVEDNPVPGQALWYRTHFPVKGQAKNHYRGFESSHFVSYEGYRIIWIRSSQKQKLDAEKRKLKIKEVEFQLNELRQKLNTYSLKKKKVIQTCIKTILKKYKSEDFFNYEIKSYRNYSRKQLSRGRPGPKTRYRVTFKTHYRLQWSLRKENIKKKANADGFFPLITNIEKKELDMRRVLKYYKYQPYLEKRHSYLKSVLEVAPVYLKIPERIEALLFLYYLALMIYALIERDMQLIMKKEKIKSLPIYPEQRECRKPSTERILELFQNISKHELLENDKLEDAFFDPLNPLQQKILKLLKIPLNFYCKN